MGVFGVCEGPGLYCQWCRSVRLLLLTTEHSQVHASRSSTALHHALPLQILVTHAMARPTPAGRTRSTRVSMCSRSSAATPTLRPRWLASARSLALPLRAAHTVVLKLKLACSDLGCRSSGMELP